MDGFLQRVSVFENGYGDQLISVKGSPSSFAGQCFGEESEMVVLTEKFNARGGSAKSGFSYTTKSLEALRVEESIVTMGLEPTWVQPASQYFMGGDSLAEKLKNRNAWLKEHKELGYYLTGKTVGCEDANDARSALSHCISYLRRKKHKPTIDLFKE